MDPNQVASRTSDPREKKLPGTPYVTLLMSGPPDIFDVDLLDYTGAPDSVYMEVRRKGNIVGVTLGEVRKAQAQRQRREARRAQPSGKRCVRVFLPLFFFPPSRLSRQCTPQKAYPATRTNGAG